MPILQSDIRAAATRANPLRVMALNEAKAASVQTAFLCHSHKDEDLAKGLQNYLVGLGWTVYIDWQDATMPPVPNRETASKIKTRIRATDWFLFLATQNSMVSRWCPWEIGFADGVKPIDTILIIPTQAADGTFHGNEYLQLYRRIDVSKATGNPVLVIEPGNEYSGKTMNEMRAVVR
jgi:hypothetical protein